MLKCNFKFILIFILSCSFHSLFSINVNTKINNEISTNNYISINDSLTQNTRKKVGLVLSGGGAKGVAHVGVLKILEQAGIPIDYIAGTSMGSIVGGLYATGYSANQLDSIIREQDWAFLLSDQIQRKNKRLSERIQSDKYIVSVPFTKDKKVQVPSGMVKGRNVYNMLSDMTIGFHDSINFLELPIPFSCIAYDLVTGKEKEMTNGELATAIRASMSIPGAFVPVEVDNMLLIDGGVINNFPVDVVKKMGAEIIIGVDVSSGKPKDLSELTGVMSIIDQLTTFMGQDKYEENVKMPDLYIHPVIEPYSAASFNTEAIDSLVNRGMTMAKSQWEEIIALKNKIGIIDSSTINIIKKPVILDNDSIYIGNIIIEGLETMDKKLLLSGLKVKENSVIHKNDLNTAIERFLGTGAFSNVSYRISKDLIIFVTEKPLNSLSLGFRFDSEEQAAIYLATKLSPFNTRNFQAELSGKLGNSPFGRLELSFGNPYKQRMGLAYKFHDLDNSVYVNGKRSYNFKFMQNSVDLFFSNFYLRNFRSMLGIRYDHYKNKELLQSSPIDTPIDESYNLISYYMQLYFDTFDQYYFPQQGNLIKLEYELNTDNGYRYKDSPPFSAISGLYRKAISTNNRFTVLPMFFGRVLVGNDIAPLKMNCAGGPLIGKYMPQQLPFIGINYIEFMKNSLFIGRIDVRYRLGSNHYISAKGNYLRQSNDIRDIFKGNGKWGAGIEYSYNTIIGPISLLIDWSSIDNRVGAFFNLGRYF